MHCKVQTLELSNLCIHAKLFIQFYFYFYTKNFGVFYLDFRV